MHVDGWMDKSSCQPCRCSLPCRPGACARGTLAGGEWQYDAAARSWGHPLNCPRVEIESWGILRSSIDVSFHDDLVHVWLKYRRSQPIEAVQVTPFTSPRCATPRLLRPAQTLPVPTTAPTTSTHPVPAPTTPMTAPHAAVQVVMGPWGGMEQVENGARMIEFSSKRWMKQSAVGPGFKGSVVQV